MRRFTKLIILSVVLLAIIALVTLAMTYDVDMFFFKNLSIAGVQEKKLEVEELMARQVQEEVKNSTAKTELQTSKNAFDVAKEAYENIDESTIEIVQEATKEEKYFVEYLWIVLGNYASTNNVDINILTPGAVNVSKEEEKNETNETNNQANDGVLDLDAEAQGSSTASTSTGGVKITIEGRYANVADFVFDVENDKALRFKLDNIRMSYAGDNAIKATFDVLSLAVLK